MFQDVWGVKQAARSGPWQPEGTAQQNILEQIAARMLRRVSGCLEISYKVLGHPKMLQGDSKSFEMQCCFSPCPAMSLVILRNYSQSGLQMS